MQTSSKRQIKREIRPDWLATRVPFFLFFILEFLLPGGVAPDLTVFYLARSFGVLQSLTVAVMFPSRIQNTPHFHIELDIFLKQPLPYV